MYSPLASQPPYPAALSFLRSTCASWNTPRIDLTHTELSRILSQLSSRIPLILVESVYRLMISISTHIKHRHGYFKSLSLAALFHLNTEHYRTVLFRFLQWLNTADFNSMWHQISSNADIDQLHAFPQESFHSCRTIQ